MAGNVALPICRIMLLTPTNVGFGLPFFVCGKEAAAADTSILTDNCDFELSLVAKNPLPFAVATPLFLLTETLYAMEKFELLLNTIVLPPTTAEMASVAVAVPVALSVFERLFKRLYNLKLLILRLIVGVFPETNEPVNPVAVDAAKEFPAKAIAKAKNKTKGRMNFM